MAAALMGGTLAATSHIAKATTRAAVNTSPEPFSNIGMSLLGDALVPTALWLSWTHPLAFVALLLACLVAMVGRSGCRFSCASWLRRSRYAAMRRS
jgi:hypothetical protein